jgi:glucose/arabinose dehydrogenase
MSISRVRLKLAVVLVSAVVVGTGRGDAQNAFSGQQTPAPTASQVPTGRQGRGGYPLPSLPAVFDTYQHKVRVSVVARGLDRPWSLLMLPDADMLQGQHPQGRRRLRLARLQLRPQ